MSETNWGGTHQPTLTILWLGELITYQFTSADRYKPKYSFLPIAKQIIEVESGKIQRRQKGYRPVFTIEFENLLNADFVEFMRKAIQVGEGYFTPHPEQLIRPDTTNDDWQVLITSDFDFEHFDDRFIGHKGTIILTGKLKDTELPVDQSGGIGGY
jgi:hypothetical protein